MAPLAGAVPSNPSPSLGVILKWLQSVADNDITTMETTLAAEYTQQCLPKSLGWPAFEKGNYLEFMTKMLAKFDNFEITIHDVVEAPGTVIVHLSSYATRAVGVPYTNEAVFTIRTREIDGKWQMVSTQEFMDSKFSAEFFAREEAQGS